MQVNRVVNGGEPTLFKQYFSSWKEETLECHHHVPIPAAVKNDRIAGKLDFFLTMTSNNDIQTILCFVSEFEISSLHKDKLRLLLKEGGGAPGFYPDDATGEKEIYRIENFELAPVDDNAHGMFFGGDSYVIKYTYETNGRQNFIVYFWQVLYSRTCNRQTF